MANLYYGLFEYNLLFSTYKEYRSKKKLIIDKIIKMDVKNKAIYRMYVYSRPLLTERQKDFIWEEIANAIREDLWK